MLKTLQVMFYPKNVPNLERLIRIIVGITLIVLAATGQGVLGSLGTIGMLVAISSAITLIGTGFIGWCPACALIGRKINTNKV